MMTGQIHGHEVLEMMIRSGKNYTKQSLEKDIHDRFGADARFYICSGAGMTAGELIEALDKKGKFVYSNNAFVFNEGKMCNH